MISFIGFVSSLIFTFSGLFCFSGSNLLPINYSFASIFHFTGNPPTDLGVDHGHLQKCPDSPNCVVSQTDDDEHYIKPLTYQSDRQSAYDNFLKILSVVPNTEIVEQTEDYIRTESTSKIMGFVDDGEFYFPSEEKVIHWRSASRLGESDLGVNRRRLEQIRLAFEDFTKKA